MFLFAFICLSIAAAALSVMAGMVGPVGVLGHEVAALAFMFSAVLSTLGLVAADG